MAGAEVVHHLAARISIVGWDADEVRSINVGGVANVVDASLNVGARRLVHISSIHALSPRPQHRAVDEGRELARDRRISAYGRSKAQGEQIVRAGVARGLDAVILNPTGILGPHDHRPSEAGRCLREIWEGRMRGLVQGGFNWVDARDVAAPRIAPPRIAARGAAQMAAVWSRLLHRPIRLSPTALDHLEEYRLILTDKAHDELGFRARPFEQTLRDVHRWYTAQQAKADPDVVDAATRMAALAAAHHGSPR